MKKIKKIIKKAVISFLALLVIFLLKTIYDFRFPAPDFYFIKSHSQNLQVLDRSGKPLTFSYKNSWNNQDVVALHEIPEVMQQAFIISEDRRFFEHNGVDWVARGNAFWQKTQGSRFSRGASTITEQVVRMLHPHRRSYWAKWIEGLEAMSLESKVNKADILEFYLNQVPYVSNRRGVVQAARFYFNRNINSLNIKEILSLVVLVRAPSKFDLYSNQVQIDDAIKRLALVLQKRGIIDQKAVDNLDGYKLDLDKMELLVEAPHFVDYVRRSEAYNLVNNSKITTTIDGNLQIFINDLLKNRLTNLLNKNVNNAAALVADHETGEVLAWVVVGSECEESNNQAKGCKIDMVTIPRQPGSALKPFLYAAALEKGWSAATIIDDSPYSEKVKNGIHHFHNYSKGYYGKVSMRTALGNSLNIPALHAAAFITPQKYLPILHDLGFASLRQSADFYGDGLALGNGEVTLFELVQAYATLANRGKFRPLKIAFNQQIFDKEKQIYSPETASLIGNILSDPWARSLEFGRGSVLNLPTQTAVKTGTSTDYRDAWAVGYNYKYVVGIWMGNANYDPSDGVTGSVGPSLALRSIFNELTKNSQTKPLFLSPKLIARDVCINLSEKEKCIPYTEYFLPQNSRNFLEQIEKVNTEIDILRPTAGLNIAFDPRVPAQKQVFEMSVSNLLESDEVEWKVDDKIYVTIGGKFFWPLAKGHHEVSAIVKRDGKIIARIAPKIFQVK